MVGSGRQNDKEEGEKETDAGNPIIKIKKWEVGLKINRVYEKEIRRGQE